MNRIASILAAVAFLAGCATAALPSASPTALKDAEQALTVAEEAHTTAGAILDAAAKTGLLHGSKAAEAKAVYDRIGTYLDAAEQADKAANANGILDAVQQAQILIGQVSILAKGQ